MSFTFQAHLVNTNAELTSAITNSTSGTTITLAKGTWTNVQISIQKTGTASNLIILKAQTAGSVFFQGNSYIKIGGEYVYIEGVVFQNPSGLTVSSSTITPVITFKASTECKNCKVTNVNIDSYNGTSSQSTSTFKWILLYGEYNEISYCSFLGKYGLGSIINDNRDTSTPHYSKIHHNYFGGRTPVIEVNVLNDQDAIGIGNSATSLLPSYTEVYDNYFYNFSGEIEVISNKSRNNKYYYNSFRDYQGCLKLRHVDNCEVFNNFFIANNKLFSGGIWIIGENHNAYNNYIEGVNSKKI
ncbi:polysaccharide lyase 6 family protein [Flavobacterium cellulosilyticum]|uniref:polysaccharide lyase 6 family protein n=1 Tax=Flavobacterium cellulosilyticum TaxID=2541731 RepID=UPI002482FD4D|nr:polysaccharide lyase 6 family protein [Flavobacterium cellulosilyticum]